TVVVWPVGSTSGCDEHPVSAAPASRTSARIRFFMVPFSRAETTTVPTESDPVGTVDSGRLLRQLEERLESLRQILVGLGVGDHVALLERRGLRIEGLLRRRERLVVAACRRRDGARIGILGGFRRGLVRAALIGLVLGRFARLGIDGIDVLVTGLGSRVATEQLVEGLGERVLESDLVTEGDKHLA